MHEVLISGNIYIKVCFQLNRRYKCYVNCIAVVKSLFIKKDCYTVKLLHMMYKLNTKSYYKKYIPNCKIYTLYFCILWIHFQYLYLKNILSIFKLNYNLSALVYIYIYILQHSMLVMPTNLFYL